MPFPARRDLYVLAAGLLLGVLLGPPGLGAVSDSGYRWLFGGSEAWATAERVRGEADTARELARDRLGLTGGEGAGPRGAARERAEAHLAQVETALTRTVSARFQAVEAAMDGRAVRWLLGLVVALAGVFVAEVMAAPVPPRPRPRPGEAEGSGPVTVSPALRRLVTVRYALLSVVLAVVLARATLYEAVPWLFVLGVLGVGLAAAWVPLGRGRVDAEGGHGTDGTDGTDGIGGRGPNPAPAGPSSASPAAPSATPPDRVNPHDHPVDGGGG